jgi:two-component system copper resistance phosphate regulon response regulator CusR
MRILIVEDSAILRESLAKGLREVGHAVDTAECGDKGIRRAIEAEYDAVVLDWMLPGQDGLAVLAALAQRSHRPGVVMLTARDAVADRVRGLDAGADDYLVKPFAFEELLARVHAVARRAHGTASSVLRVGPLEIDLVARVASAITGETRLDLGLTAREFAVLETLALRKGRLVSRVQLEDHVYDGRSRVFSNAIDSAISSIRAKMQAAHLPGLIETRRGLGYVLTEPRA